MGSLHTIAASAGLLALASMSGGQVISEFGRVPSVIHAQALFLTPDVYAVFGLAVIDKGGGWGAWTFVRQISGHETDSLGHLESYSFGDCNLRGISADGRVAVGSIWNPQLPTPMHSIKWSVEQGLQDLNVSQNNHSTAVCVSADGQIIAGIDEVRGVYRISGDEFEFVPGLNSVIRITPGGTTRLGEAQIGGVQHAVTWTRQGGMIDLGAFHPVAGTPDFSVVVGYTVSNDGVRHSIRWSQSEGIVPLPVDRFQVGDNAPIAITADAALVVGNASGLGPCVWISGTEAIGLTDYLTQCGISLAGWSLFDVLDVSPDGNVFAGSGFHSGLLLGWTASIDPICGTSDFNHDGDAGTDLDIEEFFRALSGNTCPTCGSSDFNGDTEFGTDQDIESFFRVLAGQHC